MASIRDRISAVSMPSVEATKEPPPAGDRPQPQRRIPGPGHLRAWYRRSDPRLSPPCAARQPTATPPDSDTITSDAGDVRVIVDVDTTAVPTVSRYVTGVRIGPQHHQDHLRPRTVPDPARGR